LCINITKDSLHTTFLALLKYSNGTFSYVLASYKLKPGNLIFSTIRPPKYSRPYVEGCNLILRYLSYKHIFFNLELLPGKGGKYARSAGTFCKIISFDFEKNIVKVELPTNNVKIVSMFCFVTLGRASNYEYCKQFFSKSGYNRNRNIRPTVRGVAMNPVDHPHGGRTKTNSPEVSP
jgi:large subunit ribosomal protein L2